jgi:peptidoglycan/xylan/chitin deacetylase (PgdA/CDA1 family)
MSELIHYLRTLRRRGFFVSYRELKSRLIREPPRKSIERLLHLFSEFSVPYTFFVVGDVINRHSSLIRKIIDNGHEVACHGFNHLRFDLLDENQISNQIKKFNSLCKERFGYRVRGFRAPYLKFNQKVINILGDLGMKWSSSLMRNVPPFRYNNGLIEFPIVVDDWTILIKNNKDRWVDLYNSMKNAERDKAVFLVHPWRIGQKKYIKAIERYIKKTNLNLRTVSEIARGREGIALTGDLAELSLLDLVRRM